MSTATAASEIALEASTPAIGVRTTLPTSDPSHVDSHLSHVMSPQLLLSVFFILVALTLLTVGLAQVSFGAWEVWVSLGIATLKGSLVAVYFMHLRYDKPFYAIILVSSLAFVALFLGLTMMDIQIH